MHVTYNPFIAVRNNHIDGGMKHVIFNLHLFSLMAVLRLKPLAEVTLKSENVVFNQLAANHTLFSIHCYYRHFDSLVINNNYRLADWTENLNWDKTETSL